MKFNYEVIKKIREKQKNDMKKVGLRLCYKGLKYKIKTEVKK